MTCITKFAGILGSGLLGSTLLLASAALADGPKVGIFVTDSFGDRAFFDIALGGKDLIEKNYGATVATYEGRLQADKFFRQLSDAGRANDFVFVLGFEAIDAMLEAAAANSDAHFIFIDFQARRQLGELRRLPRFRRAVSSSARWPGG